MTDPITRNGRPPATNVGVVLSALSILAVLGLGIWQVESQQSAAEREQQRALLANTIMALQAKVQSLSEQELHDQDSIGQLNAETKYTSDSLNVITSQLSDLNKQVGIISFQIGQVLPKSDTKVR